MSRKQHYFKMMDVDIVALAIHRYRIDRFDIAITGIDERSVYGHISYQLIFLRNFPEALNVITRRELCIIESPAVWKVR